jgi:hypothetical protein
MEWHLLRGPDICSVIHHQPVVPTPNLPALPPLIDAGCASARTHQSLRYGVALAALAWHLQRLLLLQGAAELTRQTAVGPAHAAVAAGSEGGGGAEHL